MELAVTALRWVLGAVAGCAAPLVCRVRGHGPFGPVPGNGVLHVVCMRCGEDV